MTTPTAPEPPTPEPDTKDWTWVLEAPCADCGFEPGTAFGDVAGRLRDVVPVFTAALDDEAAARRRPEPATWSPLEYACHVRDVCRLFRERLRLMVEQDDPLFENWDQDATALADRYDLADPRTVAVELAVQAEAMAQALDAVPPADLARPGRRSNGSVFTVESLARYFLHDAVHHAWDVRDAAGAPGEAAPADR